jgi:hypothetical protein
MRLAIAVERPGKPRFAHRQVVARLAVAAGGVPYVPGLAIAVHLALHQFFFGDGWYTRCNELA